MVPFPMILNEP